MWYGLHLLLSLPDNAHEALVEAVLRRGIRGYGARAYHSDPRHAPPALLMGQGEWLERVFGHCHLHARGCILGR